MVVLLGRFILPATHPGIKKQDKTKPSLKNGNKESCNAQRKKPPLGILTRSHPKPTTSILPADTLTSHYYRLLCSTPAPFCRKVPLATSLPAIQRTHTGAPLAELVERSVTKLASAQSIQLRYVYLLQYPITPPQAGLRPGLPWRLGTKPHGRFTGSCRSVPAAWRQGCLSPGEAAYRDIRQGRFSLEKVLTRYLCRPQQRVSHQASESSLRWCRRRRA